MDPTTPGGASAISRLFAGASCGYAGGIASVTYIGHSTLLFELNGARVLTDPALRGRILHLRRRVPMPRLEELRGLDAILISHAHHDHLDAGSLRRLGGGCPVVAPRGCGGILRRAGFRDLCEADVGDRMTIAGLEIEAVPAAHDGRRYPFGRRRPALGYLFGGAPSIYFAGDTDLFAGMEDLAGRVDVAALPVAGWGPRVPSGHLDPERAARAVDAIRPKIVIPIHWGTLAVGWRGVAVSTAPRAFEHRVAETAPEVEVRVLVPGQRLDL